MIVVSRADPGRQQSELTEQSARRSARLEREREARGRARHVEDREDTGSREERNGQLVGGTAMDPGKRGEGCALEAQLRVLGRRAGCVAPVAEVLQCMQPGRRLPQYQGHQCQPGDQRFAGHEQVRYLGSPSIFLQQCADRQLQRGTCGPRSRCVTPFDSRTRV